MLSRLAEEKKILAENLVTKLNEIIVLPLEQHFEVFQGKESYVAHEFDMLEYAKEKCEVLIIGGTGDKFNETMGVRLKDYTKRQIERGIKMRYIGSEGQREAMESVHGKRELFEVRYLPGLFTAEVNTNIWPDALAFNIFSEPVTHFTIWNPLVTKSYAGFFETLWTLAKQ